MSAPGGRLGAAFALRRPRHGASSRVRGRVAVRALAVLALALVPAAHADDEPARIDARLSWVEGAATATFDVTTAFTEAFRRRVTNGLRQTVIVEANLIGPTGAVLGRGLRTCYFKLDVWDDILNVRIREANRRFERGFTVIDRGLRQCGSVEELRVADGALLIAEAGYRVEVIVLLNPVDPETLQSAREFMSNPRGTRDSQPRTFFGAVARLFSDDRDTGGEEFVFRSARLARPRRAP